MLSIIEAFFLLFLHASYAQLVHKELSGFQLLSDFKPGASTLQFENEVKIYISSTGADDRNIYENNIFVECPDGTGSSLYVASRAIDQDGFLLPINNKAFKSYTIRNSNLEEANYSKPAVIYWANVQEDYRILTTTTAWRVSKVPTVSADIAFVTVLNPSYATEIRNIDGVREDTFLTVFGGGIEEAVNDRQKHTLGHFSGLELERKPTLTILEPVFTLSRESAMNSSFTFEVRSLGNTRDFQADLEWNQIYIAMSPGYGFSQLPSKSVSYHLQSTVPDSQYHIRLIGDVPFGSSLNITSNMGDHEGLTGMLNVDKYINTRGDQLSLDYTRGADDRSGGFLAVIECKKSSSIASTYIASVIPLIWNFIR